MEAYLQALPVLLAANVAPEDVGSDEALYLPAQLGLDGYEGQVFLGARIQPKEGDRFPTLVGVMVPMDLFAFQDTPEM